MSKKLLVASIGEFGWELMALQARARHKVKAGGYDHVVVCTNESSFDLYKDFAHEFITHDLPGIPLCNHRRITPNQPRINTHWLKTNSYFASYEARGYDILYPPEDKPDVTADYDQEFIQFGTPRPELACDILIHARARSHMSGNNWPKQQWTALVRRLKAEGLHLAVTGLRDSSYELADVDNRMDLPLCDVMDLMASSGLVIGPSSGPMCLASLCGTPHFVWFGGGKYVGATLRDRFLDHWNPFKTKCWPIKLGWQPMVNTIYQYVLNIWGELTMAKPEIHTPSNPEKRNPRQRVRITSKPKNRPAVVRATPNEKQAQLAKRAEAVRQRQARQEEVKATAAAAASAVAVDDSKEALPELDGKYLLVRVAPGIGDFSWLYSKLCTLGVPLAIQVCGGGPARTVPFAEILPKVEHSSYGGLAFPTLRRRSLPAITTKEKLLSHFPNKVVHLEINTHLEGGTRIEHWMPEISVDYHYDITISDERYEQALEVMPNRQYVAFFASGDPQIKNWHGWNEYAWLDFMQRFRKEIADVDFVLVGADWDKPLADRIERQARSNDIPFINLAGKLHIAASLFVVKASEYFISFPSGMGILADVLNTSATMFYPQTLVNMPGSYADPKNIESGQFNEILFCLPRMLIDWLKNSYKLQDRL